MSKFYQNASEQDINKGNNCEYVLYLKEDSGIARVHESEEFEKACEILTTYPFPLSCNPSNTAKIVESLTSDQIDLLFGNEKEFITGLLKEINPNFEIIAIPKTLYQLGCINRSVEDLKEFKSYKRSESDQYKPYPFNVFGGDEDEYGSKATQYLDREDSKRLWLRCNNDIINEVVKCSGLDFERLDDIGDLTEQFLYRLKGLYTEISANKDSYPVAYKHVNNSASSFKDTLLSEGDNVDIIFKRLIEFEWGSRSNDNSFLLYRGSSNFSNDALLETKPGSDSNALSLSFSDGFLAGYWHDSEDGMSMSYLLNSDLQGYAVQIRPIDYFYNRGEDRDVIFIPPISSMAALCGDGEFHHPRSKLTNSPETQFHNVQGIDGNVIINRWSKPADYPAGVDVIEFLKSPEFDNQKTQDFLKERSIFIKDLGEVQSSNEASELTTERPKYLEGILAKKEEVNENIRGKSWIDRVSDSNDSEIAK